MHFFVTLDGHLHGVRSVQVFIRKYGEAVGIKDVRSSPHNLQHTFAKLYIMNECDPYSLQDILGNTSQDIVKKYVNLWWPEMRSKHAKSSPMRRFHK
ncbi:hypothetical protein A7975_17890 [Bacillus sp. FJAT-26390]|nr:hypothetical protein A7975_17890 [Bacillus sp. FJAT-26390]